MEQRINSQIIPLSEVPTDEGDLHVRRPVILVVDDERLVADSLSAILCHSGYAAFCTYDGEAALEFASLIHPEMLISDVAMPGINGIDLALAMVCAVPDCKIILVSGHATSHDLAIARKAGHNFPLLSKPVHPSELLRHISRSLDMASPVADTHERSPLWPASQFSSAD